MYKNTTGDTNEVLGLLTKGSHITCIRDQIGFCEKKMNIKNVVSNIKIQFCYKLGKPNQIK